MASRAGRQSGRSGQGWLSALLGVGVLVTGGFLLGLVVGVVSEEPDLVVGHLAGRSTEVAWGRASGSAIEDAMPAAGGSRVAAGEATAASAVRAPSRTAPLPSVAAASPDRASSSSPDSYLIQVGAFGAEDGAGRVARDLRAKGYPVEVLPPTTDSRWRVRVGPVDDEGAAEQMAARLKKQEKLPTWVMQIESR